MDTGNIETNKLSLESILREIGRGRVQLPDFQRNWAWRDGQIKSLLASVSLGIPIGTLLTIDADVQLSHRPFAGVNPPDTIPARTLVLDGQQRLTALFQSCQWDQTVETQSRRENTPRRYYFDMKNCTGENDREEAIISENANRPNYDQPATQYAKEIFPARMMFNYREWRDGYLEYHGRREDRRNLVYEFEDRVVRNFEQYQLPEVRMSNADLEIIAITFEKTNDRGTRLNAFDIITAKMKREGLNLRDDWKRQKDDMAKEHVLEKVNETDYLKAVTLLATKATGRRASARRKDTLSLKREEYEAYHQGTTRGFLSAAALLREMGINNAKDLVHIPQATVLAAVYAQTGPKRTDTVNARETLERWYWTTLLNESYTKSSDTQMENDFTELINRLTSTKSTPNPPFPGRQFNSGRLWSGRQQSLTIATQSLLKKKNEPRDWMKGNPIGKAPDNTVEMHHVFPKRWCVDNQVSEDKRESVANLTLIDAETNRIIGGKAPSQYLKELQIRAGNISDSQMDQILESHLIPAQELRQDNFNEFHKKRAGLLKDMIAEAIGDEMIS